MYRSLSKLLFALPPECAHDMAIRALSFSPPASPVRDRAEVMGISFPNRVGLAAGFDKTGEHADTMAKLGFGFVEVGTFTPEPQQGNPKPRVFRLVGEESLVNRLGFNNPGAVRAQGNIRRQRRDGYVLGVNVGKGAKTPLERAADDYVRCLELLYPLGDYFTVNVSSPNTADLRKLQSAHALEALLERIAGLRDELSASNGRKPLAVKLSPDWEEDALRETCAVISDSGFDAVIATNTSVSRPDSVTGLRHGNESGGLSGRAISEIALRTLDAVRRRIPGGKALIACGGISSPEGVRARIASGADLIQLYTGLVYGGPSLVADLARAAATAGGREA